MLTQELLFALLRNQICGEKMPEALAEAFTPQVCEELYDLARKHDLAHLVGQGMAQCGVLRDDEISEKLRQSAFSAVMRYVKTQQTYQLVCDALEKTEIPFIPLKGSVLREYYPEPWMRTSCDIDILIHETDLDRATQMLTEEYKFQNCGRSYHDVSLFSPGGVHLELHFETVDEGNNKPERREVLSHIWENTVPTAGKKYHLCITDEMFYFYHIAHMATHFEAGGCGVRALVDTWILDHKLPENTEKRDALLKDGKLLVFANAVRRVSNMWFSGTAETGAVSQMAQFIINGGTFGTAGQRAALEKSRTGSKFAYIIKKRVFMSYSFMKTRYPILQKHKWLLPVYQVVRWVEMLLGGGLKGAVNELKGVSDVSEQTYTSAAELLNYLDL